MVLRSVLRALVAYTLWRLPIAEPYDPPNPAWLTEWRRIYTSPPERPPLHVGIGAHAGGDWTGVGGVAVTLQVTLDVL